MLIFLTSLAFAVPQQLTQQGRLLESTGAPVTGNQVLSFSIYEDLLSSDPLWTESLTVFFTNGYYSAVLGSDPANFIDSSLLTTEPLYLEIKLNNDSPFQPRQKLSSAPYARSAGVAESLNGGSVDASTISVGGTLVVDSSGSWVGPTMALNWNNITGTPAGFADGVDDDTQLSESEVETYVGNDPIDLALGSSVDAKPIVTQSAPCNDGELLLFDLGSASWICGQDTDTTLSAEQIKNMLAQNIVDLASGSTINGEQILSPSSTIEWGQLNNVPNGLDDGDDQGLNIQCSEGEILTYTNGQWTCSPFNTVIDADNDGSLTWNDCDDNDSNIGDQNSDQDCDGTPTADDCDDSDQNSTTTATDADCDGVLTADDCNDSDASLGDQSNDADCDGVLSSNDCNDNDLTFGNQSNDADCDGILTSNDCDDNDNTAFNNNGLSASCAASSCLELQNNGYGSTDGNYFLNPDGQGAFQGYCEMDQQGGGWTLLLSADGESTYWGNNSPNWSSTGSGNAPNSLQNTDHHSPAYDRLQTDKIMLCYQDADHCYTFEHSLSITLQSFFTDGITYTAFSSGSYGYNNVGSSSVLTDFETGLGATAQRHSCQWLGINEQLSISSIGYLADGNGGCNGSGYPYHDDAAFGVGLQSCEDANDCSNGGSGHKAGRSRAVNGVDSSGVLGPWFVFGQ